MNLRRTGSHFFDLLQSVSRLGLTGLLRLCGLLRDQPGRSGLFSVRLFFQAALTGGITGVVVGLFRSAADHINSASAAFVRTHDIYSPAAVLGIFAVLALLAAGAWLLVRRDPAVGGSGIPQVELTLAGHLPAMNWPKIIRLKFAATLFSLAGGLSVGREGPCIQMGAAVGTGLGQYCAAPAAGMPRFLIGGAAAGLTAAFGAPAAGLCFAFEEMKTALRPDLLLFTAIAAFASWFTVTFVFGFGPAFPFAQSTPLAPLQWWILPFLAVGTGALGALYNGILLRLTLGLDRLEHTARCRFFGLLRMSAPFLCTGLLLYFYRPVLEGLGVTATDLESLGLPLTALLLLTIVKILFSCLSFASGAAGGLLMPILLGGAMIGACVVDVLLAGQCIRPEQSTVVLMAAMTGLFAGSVRAPLTGAALITEMTRAFEHLPLLVLTAYLAAYTADRLHSAPVYDSLKQRILDREPKPSGSPIS